MSLKKIFSKINLRFAILTNGIKDATAYRIEFLLEVLGSALVPVVIQWMLWYAIFLKDGHEKIVSTNHEVLTYSLMVQYTLTSMLFSQIRGGDYDFDLVEMIRTGTLSQYLLKPINVLEFLWLRGFGTKILITFFCLMVGVIFSLIFKMSILRLLGAMFLALLGNIIHYQISAGLAAIAFIWEDAYSVLMVKNLMVSLLSGEILPLFLVPNTYKWIWASTPFYLYVYAPVQYFTEKFTHTEFFHHVVIAIFWLIFASIFTHLCWKFGLKRYTSIGG